MATGTADSWLEIELCDAWYQYLSETRNLSAERYREVEPWAWARLTARSNTIKREHKARLAKEAA